MQRADSLDLPHPAFSPRLSYDGILEGQLPQASSKDSMAPMMRNNRFHYPARRRFAAQQMPEHASFRFLPRPIDREEDFGFVVKPSIERLRCEAGASRDLVGIGPEKTVLVEFFRGGSDQSCAGLT